MTTSSADESAYLKTEFLERVAHELRGPAGVTLGALTEVEGALSDPSLAPLLAMARRGVQRIVRVAEILQHTAQFEGGHAEISRDPCDLGALTETATRDAEALEARRKVKVALERPPAPCNCLGDARWLSVVVFELVSNAIRHASSQVRIQVSARPEGGARLVVLNDGPRAEPFGPLRFARSKQRRGLGMALAIVSDVVMAHGGSLQIEPGQGTTPDAGARVTVDLPA